MSRQRKGASSSHHPTKLLGIQKRECESKGEGREGAGRPYGGRHGGAKFGSPIGGAIA
jgi:hypothetical protein